MMIFLMIIQMPNNTRKKGRMVHCSHHYSLIVDIYGTCATVERSMRYFGREDRRGTRG
jgi:hypothetical protein